MRRPLDGLEQLPVEADFRSLQRKSLARDRSAKSSFVSIAVIEARANSTLKREKKSVGAKAKDERIDFHETSIYVFNRYSRILLLAAFASVDR